MYITVKEQYLTALLDEGTISIEKRYWTSITTTSPGNWFRRLMCRARIGLRISRMVSFPVRYRQEKRLPVFSPARGGKQILSAVFQAKAPPLKDIFYSAFILAVYGVVLILVQETFNIITGLSAVWTMYLFNFFEMFNFIFQLLYKFADNLWVESVIQALAPHLLILFGKRQGKFPAVPSWFEFCIIVLRNLCGGD